MSKIRRTAYAFFYLEDEYVLDFASVLRGEAPPTAPEARILALAVLTGEHHSLSREQLQMLLAVPAERWIEPNGHDRSTLDGLLTMGLLLSDADDDRLRSLRERDESLSANQWNPYAALYHYMTQWSDVDIRADRDGDFQFDENTKARALAFAAEHGAAPGEFAEPKGKRSLRLPREDGDGELFRTLTARRTTRTFDPESTMTLESLDKVLRYVFGCHGYGRTWSDLVCIKRTSPSGGGLHPIEAYPIVRDIEGVPSGIYHYSVRDHTLSLIEEIDADDVRTTATAFMCGQSYFGAAHVTFVLTSRFYRNHWKYRRHQRAYAGIMMDAAHLSQTLYLVGGELGLGAFVTLAINGRDIEQRLGIDGVTEGVIAMSGCGPRAPGTSPLELEVSAAPTG